MNHTSDPPCPTCAAKINAEMVRLQEALVTARETNTRLNRRCQAAESGLAAKLALGGPSFGRALANSAAVMYREQLGEAQATIQELRERIEELEAQVRRLRAAQPGSP